MTSHFPLIWNSVGAALSMLLSFQRVNKNVVTPSFHCEGCQGCAVGFVGHWPHVTGPDTSHNGIKRLCSCQQHQLCQKNFKQLSSVGRAYILLKALIYHLSFNAFLPQWETAMAALCSALSHAPPANSAGTASEILLQHLEHWTTENYDENYYKLWGSIL